MFMDVNVYFTHQVHWHQTATAAAVLLASSSRQHFGPYQCYGVDRNHLVYF